MGCWFITNTSSACRNEPRAPRPLQSYDASWVCVKTFLFPLILEVIHTSIPNSNPHCSPARNCSKYIQQKSTYLGFPLYTFFARKGWLVPLLFLLRRFSICPIVAIDWRSGKGTFGGGRRNGCIQNRRYWEDAGVHIRIHGWRIVADGNKTNCGNRNALFVNSSACFCRFLTMLPPIISRPPQIAGRRCGGVHYPSSPWKNFGS